MQPETAQPASLPAHDDAARRASDSTAILGTLAGVTAWGTAVTIASAGGAFARLSPNLVPPLILAGVAVPSAIYAGSPALRRIARRVGPHRLTTLQAWRIVAGVAFLRWGARGKLPRTFAERAGWGDIAAGVLAIATLAAPKSRLAHFAVNAFGSADLAVALGTGRSLVARKEPAMRNITSFPQALIPLFGVGLTGWAHVIVFDLLSRNQSRGGS